MRYNKVQLTWQHSRAFELEVAVWERVDNRLNPTMT